MKTSSKPHKARCAPYSLRSRNAPQRNSSDAAANSQAAVPVNDGEISAAVSSRIRVTAKTSSRIKTGTRHQVNREVGEASGYSNSITTQSFDSEATVENGVDCTAATATQNPRVTRCVRGAGSGVNSNINQNTRDPLSDANHGSAENGTAIAGVSSVNSLNIQPNSDPGISYDCVDRELGLLLTTDLADTSTNSQIIHATNRTTRTAGQNSSQNSSETTGQNTSQTSSQAARVTRGQTARETTSQTASGARDQIARRTRNQTAREINSQVARGTNNQIALEIDEINAQASRETRDQSSRGTRNQIARGTRNQMAIETDEIDIQASRETRDQSSRGTRNQIARGIRNQVATETRNQMAIEIDEINTQSTRERDQSRGTRNQIARGIRNEAATETRNQMAIETDEIDIQASRETRDQSTRGTRNQFARGSRSQNTRNQTARELTRQTRASGQNDLNEAASVNIDEQIQDTSDQSTHSNGQVTRIRIRTGSAARTRIQVRISDGTRADTPSEGTRSRRATPSQSARTTGRVTRSGQSARTSGQSSRTTGPVTRATARLTRATARLSRTSGQLANLRRLHTRARITLAGMNVYHRIDSRTIRWLMTQTAEILRCWISSPETEEGLIEEFTESGNGGDSNMITPDKVLASHTRPLETPPDDLCSICICSLRQPTDFWDDEDEEPNTTNQESNNTIQTSPESHEPSSITSPESHEPNSITSQESQEPNNTSQESKEPNSITSQESQEPNNTSLESKEPNSTTSLESHEPKCTTSQESHEPKSTTSLESHEPKSTTSLESKEPNSTVSLESQEPKSTVSQESIVLEFAICHHNFHRACVKQLLKHCPNYLQCPYCKTIHGVKIGNQPTTGDMVVSRSGYKLPGHPDCGTFVIEYRFRDGVQGPEHPSPGQPYTAYAFPRVAFLPTNEKGTKVLKMLREAWRRRLIFTVGRSATTGLDNVITWADIHHKTNVWSNNSGHGYPDPEYLDNVLGELWAVGVTEESMGIQ